MKKIKLAALLLAGALALAGCSVSEQGSTDAPKANDDAQTTTQAAASEESTAEASGDTQTDGFKYGTIDIPGKDGALCGAPIYIAYENGYFAEEGFDFGKELKKRRARAIII